MTDLPQTHNRVMCYLSGISAPLQPQLRPHHCINTFLSQPESLDSPPATRNRHWLFNDKRCYLTTHDINIIILCLCNYSFLFLSTAPITVTGTFLRQETNENYVSFFWAWGINAVVVRVGQKQKSGRARTEGLF